VVEGVGIVRIGALDLGEEERDILEPRVRVRPADERIERTGRPVAVAGVELLEVLPTFCLRAGERDLRHVAHLRRPASERLDELAQRQAGRWLRTKSVFMDVLHGDRILAAVRRALSRDAPATEPACDV